MANKFLPPNFHKDAPVILIGDECWQYKAPSGQSPTTQEVDGVYQICEQCLNPASPSPSPLSPSPSPSPLIPLISPSPSPLPAAPCVCPSGLDNQYRLKGYSDGDIPACPVCDPLVGTAWTGLFERFDELCWWGRPETENVIDGVDLGTASINLSTSGDPDCYWELTIECFDDPIYPTVWYGTKATGNTPIGVYTKVSGCATGPATLEVEAVP